MVVALAIFTLPIRMLSWVFKHPKVLILCVVAIFAIVGIRACNAAFSSKNTTPQVAQAAKYQEIAPLKTEAPYVLATSSRIYYVKKYTDDKQVITLKEYYTYDQKKWKLQTTPLLIDRQYYGEVRLYERKD